MRASVTVIRLHDVSVDFPVYQGSSRSLKKTLMRAGAGGLVQVDGHVAPLFDAALGLNPDTDHVSRFP
jgi:ABC-2 type transport system ATP-binding protein/lipopolysaccharide transport system ATP-binding protein